MDKIQFIQYLWVEKYKCLENFELNFSNKVNFHYDSENRKITCVSDNEKYVDKYISDQIGLSCIVGRNGSGKTTILRLIKELLSSEYYGVSINCIVIIYDGTKYEGWCFLDANNDRCDNIAYDPRYLTLHNHAEKVNAENFRISKGKPIVKGVYNFGLQSARYIFYSNSMSRNQYISPMGIDELGTAYMIHSCKETAAEKGTDHVNEFYLKEFSDQLNLLLEMGENIENFSISYPYYVTASFLYDKKVIEQFIKDHTTEEGFSEVNDIFDNFIKLGKGNKELLLDICAKSVFYSLIYLISHIAPKIEEKEFNDIVLLVKSYSANNAFENLLELLNDSSLVNNKRPLILPNRKHYVDFMMYFKELVNDQNSEPVPKWYATWGGYDALVIPVKMEYTQNPKFPNYFFNTDVFGFFSEYRNVAGFNNFIDFSWGLSDGELSLLNIFARLFSKSAYDKIDKCYYLKNDSGSPIKGDKYAVLLLDEIDNTLHPEWQRKIVKSLCEFVEKIYSATYVHIIMTTHSPIMLSDIPKQNTVFLKRNIKTGRIESVESEETFAANIYSLFKNSFFLDDSMIGALAEKKLKQLAKEILNISKASEKIEKRILMIGDDFVRSKFMNLYNERVHKETKIETLQKRINELENQVRVLEEKQSKAEDDTI